ncbi:cytosine permease, partial [Salmonella sp. E393-2]|uniref:cytosine permease n=1 Tax=Salmonella sp. E393-2 TaxID=3240324 RepID=UPI00352B0CB8
RRWTAGPRGTAMRSLFCCRAALMGKVRRGLYTAILGFIGARTGLSTHLLAHYSFGSKGSWLPSALLGGTQVGWFGVGV